MIQFRAFHNTDTPQLAEIWRSQTGTRSIMQPMSTAVLERYVLSRPFFDARGLIVAVEGDRLRGFAHAGFGPTEDLATLSTERGATCLIMLRPDTDDEVAGELLKRSEQYLQSRGVGALYGGGNYPLAPFYHGLYGGSEFSGVLESDQRMQATFREHGYQQVKRSLILHRDLAGFRPGVDRQQMQVRRNTVFETIIDPNPASWWDACIFEQFELIKGVLRPRAGGAPLASAIFWNMETMTGTLGVHAVGVWGMEVSAGQRRQGLAKFLLGEMLRQLQSQGVALAEVHVAEENAAALSLLRQLGFEQYDASLVYLKA